MLSRMLVSVGRRWRALVAPVIAVAVVAGCLAAVVMAVLPGAPASPPGAGENASLPRPPATVPIVLRPACVTSTNVTFWLGRGTTSRIRTSSISPGSAPLIATGPVQI